MYLFPKYKRKATWERPALGSAVLHLLTAVRRLPGSATSSPASSCDGSSSGAAAQGRRRRRRERCHSRSASPMSAAEVAALRMRVRGACCCANIHECTASNFCGTGQLCPSQALPTAQWHPDDAQHGLSLNYTLPAVW